MSFQQILYIWLAVLFAAFISGAVAHIMDRRTQNLSGVPYRASMPYADWAAAEV